MEALINDYFKSCEGKPLKIKGKIARDKYGIPIILNAHPPTVNGLALALGFNSRQSLLNYQGKEEFVDTITRAKTKIEEYTESRLFDRDGSNGAKFSLQNNFKGWNNKVDLDIDEDSTGIIILSKEKEFDENE